MTHVLSSTTQFVNLAITVWFKQELELVRIDKND